MLLGLLKILGVWKPLGSAVLMFYLQPPLSGTKGDVLGPAPQAPPGLSLAVSENLGTQH